MDRYEFNIKVEQLKKLVNKKDFTTAMKIADTIDWRRVKNIRLLILVSKIYEENKEYQDAKDILLLAYERAPIGKRILASLVELAIKEENIKEAESYFKEYQEVTGNDSRSYLLQYLIAAAKGESVEKLTSLLEAYKEYDFDEHWAYELALLYHKSGRERDCVSLCDTISLWFGVGPYVEKALELKTQYEPLTSDQKELLDNREFLEKKVEKVAKELRIEEEQRIKAELEHMRVQSDSQLMGVKPKKEDLLKEAEAIEETIGIEIEELLEQDQDMLAQEIARMTTEVIAEGNQDLSANDSTKGVVSGDTIQFLPGGQPDITARIPRIVPEPEPELEPEVESEETAQVVEEKISEVGHTNVVELPVESQIEPEPQANLEPESEPVPVVKLPVEPVVSELEPEDDFIETLPEEEKPRYYHILVRSSIGEEGLKLATGALKKMHQDTNTDINKIAKISGTKLNERGILNSMPKLVGKDLIIEGASSLSEATLSELKKVIGDEHCPIAIVLIDTAEEIRNFQKKHRSVAEKFEVVVGDSEQLEVKDFVNYAKKYAHSLDCVLDELAVLALYAIAEERISDNLEMTEADAEYIIEEAAEMASKKSVRKLLVGVFSSRYNKEGNLILKEEHFKD